jgi:hypothetical protein
VALTAVVASVSGLNVAQPDLADQFGASQTTILWIINVYPLALAAREGVANAVAVSPEAGPRAQQLVHAAQQSFVDGWRRAMWVVMVVMAVLLLYILVRGPRRPGAGPQDL